MNFVSAKFKSLTNVKKNIYRVYSLYLQTEKNTFAKSLQILNCKIYFGFYYFFFHIYSYVSIFSLFQMFKLVILSCALTASLGNYAGNNNLLMSFYPRIIKIKLEKRSK